MNLKTIPTEYQSNNKSWIISDLFKQFIKVLDIKMQNKNGKNSIDQCAVHLKVKNLQNIKFVFFPVNSTSESQLLDLSIMRSFKVHYGKHIIQKHLIAMESFERSAKLSFGINISMLKCVDG